MNKLLKIILAILGGIETVFYMITPILLSLIFVKFAILDTYGVYIIYTCGLLASVFRGIKIGWLKK